MRFLTQDQIDDVLTILNERARDNGLKIVLAGGWAMNYYGSDRMTGDIDVLSESYDAARQIILEEEALGPLDIGGIAGTVSGVEVDAIVHEDRYASLFEDAFFYAKKVAGTDLFVVTPEYLAALKLAAMRGKDDQDLEYLICNRKLDIDKTCEIIREHLGPYAEDTFNQTVELCIAMGGHGRLHRRRRLS